MDLILLRHGKAESFNTQGDGARALVDKGREQARQAAKVLKQAKWLPDIVLTSPLVRARQTADAFCEAAAIPGAIIQGWLASGMHPQQAIQELCAFHDFKCVAIVGHEPDLSLLIEWLLGATTGNVEIKKGSLACIRIEPPTRRGSLVFLIPPKLSESPPA